MAGYSPRGTDDEKFYTRSVKQNSFCTLPDGTWLAGVDDAGCEHSDGVFKTYDWCVYELACQVTDDPDMYDYICAEDGIIEDWKYCEVVAAVRAGRDSFEYEAL
eukprot:scaffold124_cov65-Cylindrotheca_fusiformis.AAC.1